jgi:DNA invertase Pin-like site-specific DNA recombinase
MRRAVGIVRVSRVGDREGDGFVSPDDQRARIEEACERDGLTLIDTIEELDVSGGTPLADRAGLRRAVEAVEDGEAQVIVAAYFDRLVRSLDVQSELVRRVEKVNGEVLAVDVGAVTNGSASKWLSGTMLGAVSEYTRRSIRERSREGQADAIKRGVPPWPRVPPGYVRGGGGVLRRDPQTAPAIEEAFRMRAGGAPIRAIRERLRERGVELSYSTVQRMLGSRAYLGEIHFGGYEPNLAAHEPIIDRDLWRAVQRVKVPRGRQPKSNRLLARLGVLRCASCGGRMGPSTSYNGRYHVYRCPATTSGDCEGRAVIAAGMVEEIVVAAVRERLADVEGRASAAEGVQEAEQRLDRAQADLDAALRVLADFKDEAAARDRLAELREARDAAQEQLDQIGGAQAEVTVSADADWDKLTVDERRDLIRATIERVEVEPGRGDDRVRIRFVGEGR